MLLQIESHFEINFPSYPKGYQANTSNHGNVVRSKKGRHTKAKDKRPKIQIMVGGQTWAKWRRSWFGYMTKLWKLTLTAADRAWWTTQALDIPYTNYKNSTGDTHGKNFFLWYQFRCLDLHYDDYMPFPENADNFPYTFLPPWEPPAIDPPTIISATLDGHVTFVSLNKLSESVLLEPWACFMRHPPVRSNVSDAHPEWTPKLSTLRHPWYYYDRYDEDEYTAYFYDLSTIFPKIKTGTHATLVHCYGNPTGGSIAAGPLYPALCVDSAGLDTPWANPMQALTINYVYATVMTPAALIITNFLRASDFGFAIPLDAVPKGIRLRIYPWTPNTTVWDKTVRLMKEGVEVGQNKAIATPWAKNTSYPHVYGSATDLWETEWTADDINDPGFGASLSATLVPGYTTAMVDAFQITVWYAAPGGWFTPTTQTNFYFV